jgi:hypothetical protein
MIELRPEQRQVVDKAKPILLRHGVVYIGGETRVGKTPAGLILGKEVGWRKILIVTTIKAKVGWDEFILIEPSLKVTLINFDQLHNLADRDFDGIIVDEAHKCGQLKKPSRRAKLLKEIIGIIPTILMSGTPHPETPSQIYHQFWITSRGPFTRYKTFYIWARDFVNVKKMRINGWDVNDYKDAKGPDVAFAFAPYLVTLSQVEAGFTSFVEEEIKVVRIDSRIYEVMKILKKDKIYTTKAGDVILCDTPVKMQSVFHQLSSGTIKVGEKRIIIDKSKADYIKYNYYGQKIAIYYQFIAEGEVLKERFYNWTSDAAEFNQRKDLVFLSQFVSGREGVNLSTADILIAYNIAFSATSYWQFKARIQEKFRTKPAKLIWLFSERGIENFIYKVVVKKQNYTKQFFMKDLKQMGDLSFIFAR